MDGRYSLALISCNLEQVDQNQDSHNDDQDSAEPFLIGTIFHNSALAPQSGS